MIPAGLAGPPLSAQLLAGAGAIRAVLTGHSLSAHLDGVAGPLRPATQALSFHAMRHLGFARAVRSVLVKRMPDDPLVDGLLLLGLCLLEASLRQAHGEATAPGTPLYHEHTLVHQMVEAAASNRRTQAARGLVNAVLRRYGREREALCKRVATDPQARWNHPAWWIHTLQQAWPDQWQGILQAATLPPPMTLRTNRRQLTRDTLVHHLTAAGLACQPAGEDGIVLDEPRPVQEIPGYAQGWWSVQDLSAQQAGYLLPMADGQRVLDACAAPGGKTAHLLERQTLALTALDSDAQRLERVAANLRRLRLESNDTKLLCADATQPQDWWDGLPFDVILADVPCTGSGVVRRHPDIRWLRQEADLPRTTVLQKRIIEALWPLLAPGGHLLYVTCSVFPQEGELQIRDFLCRHGDAGRLAAPGHLLPGYNAPGDGFYYTLIAKSR